MSLLVNSVAFANTYTPVVEDDNTIIQNVSVSGTEFTSVPSTWRNMGTVGAQSKSLPAKRITMNGSTGYKLDRPYWFVNFENFSDGSSNDGKRAVLPYVSKQMFSSDGKRFVFARNDDGDSLGTLYEYNIETQSVRLLQEKISCSSSAEVYVAANDKVYCIVEGNSVYCIDWAGEAPYNKYYLGKTPKSVSGIHVTNDGRYINGYVKFGGSNHVTRYDLQNLDRSGYAKQDFQQAAPFYAKNPDSSGIGHVQINPVDPDLSFFCNEGTTNYIPDRLWIYNHRTKEIYNTFKQSMRSDGLTAECSGHEVWSENGEYLYFVKYTNNQQLGQNGIVRIPFKPTGEYSFNGYPILEDSGEREYINGDYSYWHMFPSADNRWCVGDINQPNVGLGAKYGGVRVALMSTLTYESYPLVTWAPSYSGQHPHQPHARISNGGETVAWQMSLLDSNGRASELVGVGFMDVTDLTKGDSSGSITREPFGDNHMLKWSGVADAPSDVAKSGNYQKVSSGKNIYIDIDDDFVKDECVLAKATISYMDNGRNPLKLVYSGGVLDDTYRHQFADKVIQIPRNGTGSLKTVTVDLGYANFNNINGFASDLYLTTNGSATYIQSVDVELYDSPNYGIDFTLKNNYYIIAQRNSDLKNGIANYHDYDEGNVMFNVYDYSDQELIDKGISQEVINYAVSNGYDYVGKNTDSGWVYKEATDSDGVTKTAWYSTKYVRHNNNITGGYIYFAVDNPHINNRTNSIDVTFTYLDNAKGKIYLDYTSTNPETGLSRTTINKQGTGKWVTTTITLDDSTACMYNAETKLAGGKADFKLIGEKDFYLADFRIKSNDNNDITDEDLYIQDVSWYNGTSKVNASYALESSTVTPKVKVVNNTNTPQKVLLFADVTTNRGVREKVVMSDMTTVPANGYAFVTCNETITPGSYTTVRYSVISSNLKPLDLPANDLINTKADYQGGDVTLTWDTYGEGYTYNVYRDGELYETEWMDTSYYFKFESSLRHNYQVAVCDSKNNIVYYGNSVTIDLTK